MLKKMLKLAEHYYNGVQLRPDYEKNKKEF